MLRGNAQLWRLWVNDNPLCSVPKYREEIITTSASVTVLDGAEITDTMRTFLVNWKACAPPLPRGSHQYRLCLSSVAARGTASTGLGMRSIQGMWSVQFVLHHASQVVPGPHLSKQVLQQQPAVAAARH